MVIKTWIWYCRVLPVRLNVVWYLRDNPRIMTIYNDNFRYSIRHVYHTKNGAKVTTLITQCKFVLLPRHVYFTCSFMYIEMLWKKALSVITFACYVHTSGKFCELFMWYRLWKIRTGRISRWVVFKHDEYSSWLTGSNSQQSSLPCSSMVYFEIKLTAGS